MDKRLFAINSMRELAVVPSEAHEMVTMTLSHLKRLLAKKHKRRAHRLDPDTIAEMVVTFFVGLSLEQNLKEAERPHAASSKSDARNSLALIVSSKLCLWSLFGSQ